MKEELYPRDTAEAEPDEIRLEPTRRQVNRFWIRIGMFFGCVFFGLGIEFLRTCSERLSLWLYRPLSIINVLCYAVAGVILCWWAITAEHQIRCENYLLMRLKDWLNRKRERMEGQQ
jgi:hypothetical protein